MRTAVVLALRSRQFGGRAVHIHSSRHLSLPSTLAGDLLC